MAWFGLVEDKFCNLCGAKLGVLFDNNSLKDGNRICNDCEAKLSPFFTGRKQSTLDDIKRQLEYRENNRAAVAAFNPTAVYGYNLKVYIDTAAGKFCVARGNDWRNTNPDIIDLSQVTGASVDIRENRHELKTEGEDGRMVSYDPPEYEYSYDFHLNIQVNSPWFNQIHVDLTDDNNLPTTRSEELYRQYDAMSRECVAVLRRQAMPGSYTNGMNMSGFGAMSIVGALGAVLGAMGNNNANSMMQGMQQGLMQAGMQPGMMNQGMMQPGMQQMNGMPQSIPPMPPGMVNMQMDCRAPQANGMPMQPGMMNQGMMQPGMQQMNGMPMQNQMPMQQGMMNQGMANQQPMQARCQSCGWTGPQTGKFCPNCGSPLM